MLLACFWWCLSEFCEVRVAQPAQAPTKTRKKPTRCAKHAHAPKQRQTRTLGALLSCLFCCFRCLCRFCASGGCVFHEKTKAIQGSIFAFLLGFTALKCIEDWHLQCFVMFLFEKSIPCVPSFSTRKVRPTHQKRLGLSP